MRRKKNDIKEHLELNQKTLQFLNLKGVKNDATISIHFYFQSSNLDDIMRLSYKLRDEGYVIESIEHSDIADDFVLTCIGSNFKVKESFITSWTIYICEAANCYNVIFSGWEINSKLW